jgi:hypothetical protein
VNEKLLALLGGAKEPGQVALNMVSKRLILAGYVAWFLMGRVEAATSDIANVAALAGLVLVTGLYCLAETWGLVAQAKRPLVVQQPQPPASTETPTP